MMLAQDSRAPSNMLRSILSRRIYAKQVRSLCITTSGEDETSPLDDRDLVDLVEHLTRLESITWRTDRLPPRRLGRALARLTRLTRFSLSLEGDADLRYDGHILDYLPQSITRMDLADLSQLGVSALGLNAAAMLNLRTLRIERTRFVDDALMEALATCVHLRALSLSKMGGTKVC